MLQIEEASLPNFFLIKYVYMYKHVCMYYYAMKRKISYHIPQSRMNFEGIMLSELCQRK